MQRNIILTDIQKFPGRLEKLSFTPSLRLPNENHSPKAHSSSPSIPKSRTPYAEFYQNFNNLLNKIDVNPLSNNLPPVPKRLSKSPEKHFITDDTKKLDYIISKLKERIKSYPNDHSICTTSNRINIKPETDIKIGPGCYMLTESPSIEAHNFSQMPRLCSPLSHNILQMQTLHQKISSKSDYIKKNRFLAVNPLDYKEIVENKLAKAKEKESEIKNKKKSIEYMKKIEKIEKISRKMQLYEWRMRKKQVAKFKKFWIAFYVATGFTRVILIKGRIKKMLKSRWEIFLAKFVVASKVVAKFMKSLKEIRNRIVDKRIKGLSEPFVDFIKLRVANEKKKFSYFIEEYHYMPHLLILYVKFKFSVLKLQRNIRSYLRIKRFRMAVLAVMWDRQFQTIIGQKAIEGSNKLHPLEKVSTIPLRSKEKYLKRFLKNQMRSHAQETKIYKYKFLQYEIDREKAIGMKKFYMKKPVFKLFAQKEKVTKLVHHAIKVKEIKDNKKRRQKFSNLVSHDIPPCNTLHK